MAATISPAGLWAGAGQVLTLFLIPIGGGIPAGVLLARSRGIPWLAMTAIYFVSDVILARVFEPLLRLMMAGGRRAPLLGRVADAFRDAMRQTTSCYGSAGGPLALVLIAFGVDPMTGRAAAAAAGHGFVSGWAIAIAGDMIYFVVIMASTLCLNSVLGNGTVTMVIMLAAMFVLPMVIGRWRKRAGRSGDAA